MQCGGEKSALAAAEPYLKLMGRHVVHCGQSGNGQAAKVCSRPVHELDDCTVLHHPCIICAHFIVWLTVDAPLTHLI